MEEEESKRRRTYKASARFWPPRGGSNSSVLSALQVESTCTPSLYTPTVCCSSSATTGNSHSCLLYKEPTLIWRVISVSPGAKPSEICVPSTTMTVRISRYCQPLPCPSTSPIGAEEKTASRRCSQAFLATGSRSPCTLVHRTLRTRVPAGHSHSLPFRSYSSSRPLSRTSPRTSTRSSPSSPPSSRSRP